MSLTAVGLLLNIAGAISLWLVSLTAGNENPAPTGGEPPRSRPIFGHGGNFAVSELSRHNAAIGALWRIGWNLFVLGFVLQLIDAW